MKIAVNRSAQLEIAIWLLLAVLCLVTLSRFRRMPLTDDSYQYLSVAGNIRGGQGIVTNLVHFDSERSNGRIPAPLTTFPPGYPFAIAIGSWLSSSLESAGRLCSGVAYAGTAALLIWCLLVLGCNVFVRQIVLIAFVANAVNLNFGTAVLTESTFMLVCMGAILALVVLERGALRPRVAVWIAVIAYTLVGAAYWIRYAGLFLILAVVVYAVVRFVFQRNRYRATCLIAALIPVALGGIIMLRNVLIVGTWRGGNDMEVHNPLSGVAADYLRAQIHLVLGQHALRWGFWEIALLTGVIALLIPVVKHPRRPVNSVVLVGFCVAVYSAGIVYAGLRTPISFGTRMFLPMLPLYLLILGHGLSWLSSHWSAGASSLMFKAVVSLSLLGYLGSNARDLREPLKPAEYEVLAKEFAEPIANGQSLRSWVQEHILPTDRIFAEDGQATGYLLQRPTVSLVGPRYSRMRWECDPLQREMGRFRAHYLVLYKNPTNLDDLELLSTSTFLSGVRAQIPTCGFIVGAENNDVRILEFSATSDGSRDRPPPGEDRIYAVVPY
jgi:hypothetical protein